jgi:phosphatidylinositol glycan class C protein
MKAHHQQGLRSGTEISDDAGMETGDGCRGGSANNTTRPNNFAGERGPGSRGWFSANASPDPNFIALLETNSRLTWRSVRDVFERTTRIAFQLSVVVLFLLTYYHLRVETFSPDNMLKTCWVICLGGHVIYQWVTCSPIELGIDGIRKLYPKEHLRVSGVFIVFSFLLAPVLHTLTATISTDTIHAVSVLMIVFHLLTSDYGVSGFMVSKTISINAGIIGAICLSSRLATDRHCQALMTMAVLVFILFPSFAKIIWDSAVALAICVTILSLASSTVSINYFLAYIIVMFLLTFVVPVAYVINQKYKQNLHGPWDEAVLGNAERVVGFVDGNDVASQD